MNEELKMHLDILFRDVPKSKGALELKEELLANSMERYEDLINDGISMEDALDSVINSIGDVSKLFAEFKYENHNSKGENMEMIKKAALYKTAAIGIYISGFILMIIAIEFTPYDILGLLALLIMGAIGTCLLVYTNAVYPKYIRQEDTIIEEFKE